MNDATATILVVEDNPIARKMVRVALTAEGFIVHEAGDGASALDLMTRLRPDLILQDVRLPDMDGMELLARLRQVPGSEDIPIIAVTGFRPEAEHLRTTAAEFTEWLFKPVEPSTLVRVVRTHLLRATAPHAEAPGSRILIVEDDAVLRRLAGIQFRAAGFEVTTVIDGLDGLSLARRLRPDVVLSDVLMPRMDGFRLCAAIKGDPELAHTPVVLTSGAFIGESDAELARESGAERLVVRTSDQRDLIEAVRLAMASPRATAHHTSTVPDAEHYLQRVVKQLERQARLNASLAQRLAQRNGELAVITAAMEAVTEMSSGASVLSQMFERTCNGCGIPRGAAYLIDETGALVLEAAYGLEADVGHPAAQIGHNSALLEVALHAAEPVALSATSVTTGPCIAAPLRLGDRPIGVFWMELDPGVAAPEEWSPFAAALGAQLAQGIALGRAFADAAAGREAARRDELRREQMQIKDEFLSHVSHELRSPLVAIHQFVTILLDGLGGDLAVEQREYLQIVLRNANELRAMIDSLLEATRSQVARLSIRPESVNLVDLVGDVLASLRPSADARCVTLEAEAPDWQPVVSADPARVGQILSNLVGNAVKFTNEGGRVDVAMAIDPDEPGALRVTVANTGPGVLPADRERIFDYLYQGANVAPLTRKGFGIGLHVCRDLVSRQGGRIWVESEPGKSTLFHFTLPLAPAAAPLRAEPDAEPLGVR